MKRALSLILVLIMVCSMMLSSCYGERGASTNEADTVHNNTENNTTEKETEKSVESQNGEKTDSATSSAITGVIKPDKTDLINEIAVAEAIVEGKTADNYVADSWRSYVSALDDAKAVQEKENATEAEITSAYTALQIAIDKLKVNGTTVMFGTYNVSGSTDSDAVAIAKEILQDTSNNQRKIDVIGFQGLASEAQLTAIYNALKNNGYVSYKYFSGANGSIGFISKLSVRNPGTHNPKVITGENGFKLGYAQLVAIGPDGTQSPINFYVCSLSDTQSTRADQIADIKNEIDKSNNAGTGYSKSNYFIAGSFGTSDYREFSGIKNNLAIANRTYVTSSGSKGPWGTTIADANSTTGKNTVYPDGFLYHDDAWELTISRNGAFRRGTTNKSVDINKNHGLSHLLCYTEALLLSTIDTESTDPNGSSNNSTSNGGNGNASTDSGSVTPTPEEEKTPKEPKVTFGTYNVIGSTVTDASAIANEILQDTNGKLRGIDVVALQGLESEEQLIAIYNALADSGYVYYKYFNGASGGVGFISKLAVSNPNNYNPKTITGASGFKFGYAQLTATSEDGKQALVNFYVCCLSGDDATRVDEIADLKTEIDRVNGAGTGYSKSNYFIAGSFGTSDYNEFNVISNSLAVANRIYATSSGDKGPWGTTVADANDTVNKNTVYPDGFLYHEGAWELTVLTNGAFRRGTTKKTADINSNHGITHLLCYTEATFVTTGASGNVTITDQGDTSHTHIFSEWSTVKEADCLNKGEAERTCECGAREVKSVAALGHNKVNDPARAATCTEKGLTAGQHCSRCDKVFTAQAEVGALGHVRVTDPARAATCTEKGITAGEHCSRCESVLTAQEEIAALGHNKVKDAARAATCTESGLTAGEHCSRCSVVLTKQEVIKAKGHSAATSSKEPTCTEYGWTASGTCSTCGVTLGETKYLKPTGHTVVDHKCVDCSYERIDFSNVDIYASDYGYNYLGTMTNGARMQTLYSRIAEAARDFHVNNKTATTLTIECSDLGFKTTESYVQLAVSRFLYDNPLYYWLSGGYSYRYYPSNNVVASLILNIAPEYSDGSVRAEYNSVIYEVAEEYYSAVENEESAYNITLAYYDMIIADVNYAYESDGVTPQDDKWAHSIIGVFTKDGVVCEGYAKALQLMLTVSDVESIFVTGDAGGPHAWSMIQLDDGQWYWFDATWDDAGGQYDDWLAGKGYFTAIDTTANSQGKTFVQTHVADIDDAWGWPSLPSRATTDFDGADILEVLDTFVIGGNTYQVVGYYKVHLVASSANSGTLEIEEIVLYNGELYDVVGTGTMKSTGQLVFDAVLANRSVSEIIFSDSIVNIQGFLNCRSLTSVTISNNTENIIMYAFAYCTSLKTINFEGTVAEWNAISKGSDWKLGCGTITVYCTNGTLTV